MQMPEMPQPTFYIFKCEQSSPPGMPKPSCVSEQTRDLFNHMAQSLMQKGIMGPVMMMEPGHHMYVHLTKEKIDRIIDEHMIGGNPVDEYLIPEQFWGEAQDISK